MSCRPRTRRRAARHRARAGMRRVRRAARTPHPRPGVPLVLALDSPADAAALRPLRRPAADVADRQPRRRAMRALPAGDAQRQSRACRRRLRRRPAGGDSRAEIRRAPFAGAAAGCVDARPRRRDARARRLRRAGTAAPVPAPAARLQPGRRSRAPPRRAAVPRVAARPRDADADRFALGAAASEHAQRVRANPRWPPPGWFNRRPDRRCQHDRRDARRLRGGAEGDRAYAKFAR